MLKDKIKKEPVKTNSGQPGLTYQIYKPSYETRITL
jgi:hypothetical protein